MPETQYVRTSVDTVVALEESAVKLMDIPSPTAEAFPLTASKDMPTINVPYPFQQGFVEVAKDRAKKPIKLYYELHGAGKKRVVLIAGLSTSCQAWDYQTAYFGAHGDYTALTFDVRGTGWSDAPWGFYSTTDMAFDLFDLLTYLGWNSDVHIVGISMGGMLALKAMTLRPKLFISSCLMATKAGESGTPFIAVYTLVTNLFKDPEVAMKRNIRINFTRSWLIQSAKEEGFDTNFDKVFNRQKERAVRNRPQPMSGMLSQTFAVFRHTVTVKQLRAIKATQLPIFVCVGTSDNFIKTKSSYYLRRHLEPLKFHVFQDTGHVISSCRPRELCEQLVEFWNACEAKCAKVDEQVATVVEI